MTLVRILKTSALVLAPFAILADDIIAMNDVQNTQIKPPDLAIEDKPLHIEANQISLGQMLKALQSQTDVRLHFSSLSQSQKLISAHCAGNTVEVLKCLLGEDVSLMYKYPDGATASKKAGQPSDIWVLETGQNRPDQQPIIAGDCRGIENTEDSYRPNTSQQSVSNDFHLSADETKKLLKLSQSQNSMQRKEALTRLAIEGEAGDIKVTSALEAALTDDESSVRAQAIAGLARRNEPGAESALRDALQDPVAEVRLMAVDSAGENIALLEQALNDPNETVRALATMKLERLDGTQ